MTGANRTEEQWKKIDEYAENDTYVQFLIMVEDDGAK